MRHETKITIVALGSVSFCKIRCLFFKSQRTIRLCVTGASCPVADIRMVFNKHTCLNEHIIHVSALVTRYIPPLSKRKVAAEYIIHGFVLQEGVLREHDACASVPVCHEDSQHSESELFIHIPRGAHTLFPPNTTHTHRRAHWAVSSPLGAQHPVSI